MIYNNVQRYPDNLHPDLLSLSNARAPGDKARVTSEHLVVHKGQHKHHSEECVGMGDDTNWVQRSRRTSPVTMKDS